MWGTLVKFYSERDVRNRSIFVTLRWVSVFLVFLAVALTAIELVRYSRIRSSFPPGLVIAGVPVGGLDQEQASDRLLQAYTAVPVELRYRDAVIQIRPTVFGFELDMSAMLTAADLERVQQPFWPGFWNFLWNRTQKPAEVPLRATYSEDRLRAFLKDEVAVRYDEPASEALPLSGNAGFQPGKSGTVLDVDRAVLLIDTAIRSPGSRVVNLSYDKIKAPRPSFQNLEILLKQMVETSKFDGILEIYMKDLQTDQEIHFAYNKGSITAPDIAFTAASTMKIPIMVSTYRRIPEPTPDDIKEQLQLMIDRSENDPADTLMEKIDRNSGPLEVTKDMQQLGLPDTFLAGYFYPGAPLLKRIQTLANQRTDINASPDPYNQTTPTEMGMLLEDIYRCAKDGNGTFAAAFPGQFSKNKCQEMISYLAGNKIGVFLQAGLPEGTRIAHKHGWIIENDGLMHTIGDAGIIYSPGGDYLVSIYMYHPVQMLFDQANTIVAQISQAIYNYYNQSTGSE